MAISKALAQAPIASSQGLAALPTQPLEIEVENPDSVTLRKGDKALTITPTDAPDNFGANLAEEMDERDLQSLASELIADYEEDNQSRKEWLQTYVDGIEALGIKSMEERTEPWEGACAVTHPLLIEAVVKFQAEIMTATFPAMGPVKTQVIGKETQDLKEASLRVQDDMNYQLTEVMLEYRPEHEKLLFSLGLCGNAFKKIYFDPSLDRQVSMFATADDVVVPYGAANIETAPRITHIMRKTANDVKKLMYEGFYRDMDLGEPSNTLEDIEKQVAERLGFRASTDNRFRLLEMQVNLDLKDYPHKDAKGHETGIELPYIVTIEKGTHKILAIRRNWDPDDKKKLRRNHFVHYGYIPGFGFYNLGLINLIGGFAKSGTSLLRQLVDAGTLSNLQGGFKSNGLRVKGDDTPIAPGEFRDVDVPSGTLKDNILPLPFKEPSQVLLALLQAVVDEGRKFANSADLAVADMSANTPVGTTLAVLERTLKLMSSIQARVHYAMKRELQLLRDIIRDYTPAEYTYEPEEGGRQIKRSDYRQIAVIPVSDPNAATLAQRVVQYQAVLQLAQSKPEIYDMPLLHRQMLEVLGVKDYQKLVPMAEDSKPRDPVTENQNILKGKPVRAFLYQDHQSHIIVHMAALHDPQVQQVLMSAYGNNPQAMQALQAALGAHVAEHLGYEYRKQIEQAMGRPLPTYGENAEDNDAQIGIPADIELQVSQLAAQASQQLLQQHTQQAQDQQNQQKQQDPVIQLQAQELQIKQQDLQRKAKKDAADIALKAQEIAIQQQKVKESGEAAGATVAANIHAATAKLQAQKEADTQKSNDAMIEAAMARAHEIRKQSSEQEHKLKLVEKQPKSGGSTR